MKRKISFMSVYWILNYHNQYKHAKYTKNNFPMAITVLGQLPPRKIAPNPKTNPNPNQGAIFLGGNCLVAPQP